MTDIIESGEKFQIGSVLNRTWSALWAQPGMFLGLTLLSLVIPGLLGGLLVSALAAPGFIFGSEAADIISMLVAFLLVVMFLMLFHGAMSYGVFQIFMGGRTSVRESLGHAVSRVIDLFLVAFWALWRTLGIMMFLYLIVIVGVAVIGIVGSWMLSLVAVIVAFIVIFPPSIAYCRWCVAAPICVIERAWSQQSIKRSAQLTKGRRLKIFGLLALVMIIIGIISGAANFIVKHTIGIGWGGGFILLIVNVAPVAFINVMSAVIYCSLRAEKENLAARSLEDIFD